MSRREGTEASAEGASTRPPVGRSGHGLRVRHDRVGVGSLDARLNVLDSLDRMNWDALEIRRYFAGYIFLRSQALLPRAGPAAEGAPGVDAPASSDEDKDRDGRTHSLVVMSAVGTLSSCPGTDATLI
jgi:hypothetical protein